MSDVLVSDGEVTTVVEAALAVEVITTGEVPTVIETAGAQGPPGPSTNEAFYLDLNAVYQIAKL